MNTRKKANESLLTWVISIGVIITLAIVFALLLRSTYVSNSLTSSRATSPPDVTEFATSAPIVTGTPESDLPFERQTVEAILQETRFAVTIPAQDGTSFYDPPTPVLTTPEPWNWGSGILNSGDAPFSAMQYTISNSWFGMVNDLRVLIYVGGVKDNPGVTLDALQGVVIVITASSDREYPPEFYYSPLKAGPLIITEEDNLRLILTTQNDSITYFDIPSRKYVDSLTVTPPPTITSIPNPSPIPIPTSYP